MSMRGIMRALRTTLVVGTVLVCAACERVNTISDLSQQQAFEVAAALTQGGIKAAVSREGGSKGRYQVTVPEHDYARAITVLAAQELPSEPQPSFADLTAGSGFLPPSRDNENARLDRALAGELERIIEGTPGVEDARAVVRLNYRPADENPSVALAIQRTDPPAEGEQTSGGDEQLRAVVQRAVPGIKSEAISISTRQARRFVPRNDDLPSHGVRLKSFLLWRIPEDDYEGLALAVIGCILAMGLVGGLLGYWFGFYQYSRQGDAAGVRELDQGFLRVGTAGRSGGTRSGMEGPS